ncbi:alpha/beta hydrolase [Paenibacillus sp. MMS18-CY102]|uniref:alpha/beta hydrolase n=1 Tax=Paenibacillus sp. MMS18-CY102 TaxID=2682849 RepID=UPI00136602E7|nr:alpha/beta hydrolase [Paenibacillus sp. MMS18-CY102]MWC30313.1 alpha/beta fold hydrolase [Paenibacillus sp. MMS18-CY102]
MVQSNAFALASPVDGIRLQAYEWPAGKAPIGVVCLIHGMGEHQGRQMAMIRPLHEAGFAVFSYDQRGHGRSEGRRGHARYIEHLTRDAEAVIQEAARKYPEVPLFLYGHSMGGNVAVNCALRHQPKLQGLILSSPWLRLAFQPPQWKVRLSRMIGSIWPTFTQSAGLQPGELYRAGNPLAASNKDEWSHGQISAAMFNAMTDGGEWAIKHGGELSVPTLILHGTADRITSASASRQLAETMAPKLSTYVSLEGGYHELHHDPEGPETLRTVTNWLRDR